MFRQGIITIFLGVLTVFTFAQNQREFYVDAPKIVIAGETFQITYTLKNPKSTHPGFYPPNAPDGVTFYGTSTYRSQQSSISVINGRLKSVTTTTVTWILTAVANKPGQITIGPATVVDGSDKLKSNPVTIQVQGGQVNNLPQPKNNPNIAEQNVYNQQNKDLFLELVASKQRAYLGEAIFVYTKVYSRYQISIDDMKPAKFPGFWVNDLQMPSRIQAKDVIINGRHYLTAILDKKVIFPQQTGNLKIAPYSLTVSVYDNFGFPYGQKTITSNPLTIHVLPLPAENKPANFSGAVGRFNLNVQIDKDQVNVDEPLTIKVVISGVGNFGIFDIPTPSVPGSFEELEPKEIPQYTATEAGLNGRIVKEFIYIPRATGTFNLPPIVFNYFDPQTKQYKTLTSQPVTIKVTGHLDTTHVYASYGSNAQAIGSDINYIYVGKFKLYRKGHFFAGSLWHWLSYIILLLVFAIVVYFGRKTIKLRSDVKSFKARQASKISQKRLQQARRLMKHNEKEKFYEEVANALWGYIGDKLGIDPAELTREKIREELAQRNVPQDLINEFIQTIDYCEFARYAPAQQDFSMQEIYQKAYKLIDQLEKLTNNKS